MIITDIRLLLNDKRIQESYEEIVQETDNGKENIIINQLKERARP